MNQVNKRRQTLVNITVIVSILLVCLHLLNKEYKWFPPYVFCIRTVFVIFILNLALLIVYVFGPKNKN